MHAEFVPWARRASLNLIALAFISLFQQEKKEEEKPKYVSALETFSRLKNLWHYCYPLSLYDITYKAFEWFIFKLAMQ